MVSYTDSNTHIRDADWTLTWLGTSDGDDLLEKNEAAEITLWLHPRQSDGTYNLATSSDNYLETRSSVNTEFSVEVKPSKGSAFRIDRTLPPALDAVMGLN